MRTPKLEKDEIAERPSRVFLEGQFQYNTESWVLAGRQAFSSPVFVPVLLTKLQGECMKNFWLRVTAGIFCVLFCCLPPAAGAPRPDAPPVSLAQYRAREEDKVRISVYQFAVGQNPAERHWFLASDRNSASDPDDAVRKFFVGNPKIQIYSEAAWRRTPYPKSPFVGDTSVALRLVDKATGEPATAMGLESVVWKTNKEVTVTLAFWDNNTGLVSGPVYTLVKTGRGWVVDLLKTGFWGEVP